MPTEESKADVNIIKHICFAVVDIAFHPFDVTITPLWL
jgi:hypothetical protein